MPNSPPSAPNPSSAGPPHNAARPFPTLHHSCAVTRQGAGLRRSRESRCEAAVGNWLNFITVGGMMTGRAWGADQAAALDGRLAARLPVVVPHFHP
jgi:hypothetical protein